jgi:hypothetical protein
LNVHIFYILFLVNDKDIKFLTDLTIFEQLISINFIIIMAFAAMSGIPPFISF